MAGSSSEETQRILLSAPPSSLEVAEGVYDSLRKEGFEPWLASRDLLPGEDAVKALVRQAQSRAAVLFFDKDWRRDKRFRRDLYEIEEWQADGLLVIPARVEPGAVVPSHLAWIQSVDLFRSDGFDKLLASLRAVGSGDSRFQIAPLGFDAPHPVDKKARRTRGLGNPTRSVGIAEAAPASLELLSIEIHNIRCFEHLALDLSLRDKPAGWIMIMGDNASGKSTLLRALALGLCNESDAVSLMKEVPGGFVRDGASEGSIVLRLRHSEAASEIEVTTRIVQGQDDDDEVVRKSYEPAGFPWQDLFVCGYGTQRTRQSHSGSETYSVREAVATLFDDQASLQNPELVLLRQSPAERAMIEDKLLDILMLDPGEYEIVYPPSGFEILGPWGSQPVTVMSDGYRSTAQWVLDFIGWAILANRLMKGRSAGGVLLMDEVEQHLHPKWQRYVAERLREQFPSMQIVATSHTPLVASGVADIEGSILIRLERDDSGSISASVLDREELQGKRADQVLTSEAFGLTTTRSPGSLDDIERYAELLGREELSGSEKNELPSLRRRLQDQLQGGESRIQQQVESAVHVALQQVLEEPRSEIVDLEVKRQLKALFSTAPDATH